MKDYYFFVVFFQYVRVCIQEILKKYLVLEEEEILLYDVKNRFVVEDYKVIYIFLFVDVVVMDGYVVMVEEIFDVYDINLKYFENFKIV